MSLPSLIRRLSPGENVATAERGRVGGFAAYLVVLTLLFIQPLWRLAAHAAGSSLHSHILLVPFIAAYLLYLRRAQAPAAQASSLTGTAVMGVAGAGVLTAWFGLRGSLSVNDGLALAALAFICFVAAGGFLFLGSAWMRASTFPFSFLIFMVPLPDAWVDGLEKASMLASAEAAAFYFDLAGMPHVRQGTVFELPNIVLEVAQECSGIRSSWVLFITSVVAANVFLRSWWSRLLLVAFVIPLGILRNGFRILVIGLLCVHVGRHMIHSPIHHRGGPIFFALSLIPLTLLLWWLWRLERRPASRR
ncbi:MAG: archaeosortase/exosortase family protein [Bryobacteraceae bacterium]|nr:archaeosortase/exosortase family protein [Bryobacteraceae bacterium]